MQQIDNIGIEVLLKNLKNSDFQNLKDFRWRIVGPPLKLPHRLSGGGERTRTPFTVYLESQYILGTWEAMIGKLFSNWQNYPLEGNGSYPQKYLTNEQVKKKKLMTNWVRQT